MLEPKQIKAIAQRTGLTRPVAGPRCIVAFTDEFGPDFTPQQVAAYGRTNWLRVPNLGARSVEYAEQWLAGHGIMWDDTPDAMRARSDLAALRALVERRGLSWVVDNAREFKDTQS
jgi:hypothetical protein